VYNVTTLTLGPKDFPNFIYLVEDPSSADVVIVDPAWDPDAVIKTIETARLQLRGILLTHAHSDHMDAVADIVTHTPVPVYLSKEEIDFSGISIGGLLSCYHEQPLQLGSITVEPLLTPGHTVGSTCYLAHNSLFTGDTLFIEGCGHTDAPGGCPNTLYASLQYLKREISEDTLVYPGHRYLRSPGVALRDIRRHNIYLNIKSQVAFVDFLTRRAKYKRREN